MHNLYQKLNLSDRQLSLYLNHRVQPDTNARIKAMLEHQYHSINGWKRLQQLLQVYQQAKRSRVIVENIELEIMLNTTRRPSLQATPLDQRKPGHCFLCELEPGQRGLLLLQDRYFATPNPGITHKGDLTILHVNHLPQLINGHFKEMMDLCRLLPDFTIYFNGVLCGASSPHLHFQAGLKNKLIGYQQLQRTLKLNGNKRIQFNPLLKHSRIKVYRIQNFLRPIILIQTSDRDLLNSTFNSTLEILTEISTRIKGRSNIPDFGGFIAAINRLESEARVNLFLDYQKDYDEYLCGIFPRLTNRPSLYFHPDENQKLILGLAIKESLGCLITGREIDYQRLIQSPVLIKQIFQETFFDDEMMMDFEAIFKDRLLGIAG